MTGDTVAHLHPLNSSHWMVVLRCVNNQNVSEIAEQKQDLKTFVNLQLVVICKMILKESGPGESVPKGLSKIKQTGAESTV